VLLAASGLLLRSFEKMRSAELGFRPQNVTSASYSLPQKQYATQASVDSFNRELLLRLQQIPGAVTAGLTSFLPASNSNSNETFMVEGYVPPKGAGLNLAVPVQVLGDYFHTMGIALLRGRFFTEADKGDARLVAIVNRKFAQHYWPNQDPLGKRLRIGTQEMQTPWLTVVGEIADVKLNSPDADTKEQFYQPVGQVEASIGSLASPTDVNGNGGFIAFRGTLPPESIENVLRATVRSIDQQLPLTQVTTMEQAISETEAPRRFNTAVITGFAAAALLLAVLGIYSVIAFSVASRAQEMAIRMALGSQRSGIMRLVLMSGAKLAGIGCVIGLLGAVAASGLLRSLLFDVSPFDPMVLTLAAIAVLLLALTASAIPAQRAASIEPMRALRAD
jgi:predicted permease